MKTFLSVRSLLLLTIIARKPKWHIGDIRTEFNSHFTQPLGGSSLSQSLSSGSYYTTIGRMVKQGLVVRVGENKICVTPEGKAALKDHRKTLARFMKAA